MKYKELWEQMCQRCDELDRQLAKQDQPPLGFLNNYRQRINFEPNGTGVSSMPMTVNWKIPLYGSPQPQRKPLTRAQIINSLTGIFNFTSIDYDKVIEPIVRAIEQTHGIGKETP